MRNFVMLIGAAAALGGCGQSGDQPAAANASAATEAPKKKPPFCFFKDADMKGWAASVDAQGNVTVTGKAYRSDPRYQAVFSEPEIEGATAVVRPTIVQNTGYASPDNWWDVSVTLPASAAVKAVEVRCGAKLIAELPVRRAK
jgi:hypothetical protein